MKNICVHHSKFGHRGPFGVNSLRYRIATLSAGSPQIADITSTVDGKTLGAEDRLV
jgi:hypothetical protein